MGTGRYAPGSTLPDLPSVDTTLDALERALVNVCGIAAERVHRVPVDAGPAEVIAAVEQACADVPVTVLLYFVGHGLLGPRDELYLATGLSMSSDSVSAAVPYRTLRDLLGESGSGAVVVLDCCFSGRADSPRGRADGGFTPYRPDGSFLLSSASHYALSFAPDGEPYTRFSGALLELLEEGDPNGPLWLTMDHLYAALASDTDSGTRPRRQSDGSLGALVVARNRAYHGDTAPEAVPPADVPCPYPGLEAFRAQDSDDFYGREDLTRALLDAVCGTDRHTPVALVGASGVGKSSLLRAGLIAGLEQRRAEGRDEARWPALLLANPGAHPLRTLADLWARAAGGDAEATLRTLERGSFPEPPPGRRAPGVLVVDQFEEVFTRCQDASERARFLNLVTGSGPGPRVVLGLRADHYGSALTHPPLAAALGRGQVLVPPLRDDALRSAIEAPAAGTGLRLEVGLADRLLHDLKQGHSDGHQGAVAALPFLAHALRETWLRRSGTVLTLVGYQATGGIWDSVATTAERVYQSLDTADRGILRALLLRLVYLAPDGAEPVTRREAGNDELLDGFAAPRRRRAAAILERLAEARLVTVDQADTSISHEALLRAWPRLRRWTEEDRARLLLRQQMQEDAEAWEAAGRDPSYLYRGTRLAGVDTGLTEGTPHSPLREREWAFLDAARSADRDERDLELRRTRRLKLALTGVAGGLCLALAAGGLAFQQRTTATHQRTLANIRSLTAAAQNLRDTQPATALRLALAAHRAQPSSDTRAALFDTLRHTRLRATSRLPRPEQSSRAVAEDARWAISPDGAMLAGADRGRLAVWRIGQDATLTRLTGPDGGCAAALGSVAFSGDGTVLAAQCGTRAIQLWQVDRSRLRPRGEVPYDADSQSVSLALDPEATLLAAGGGKGVTLWRLTGTEAGNIYRTDTEPITSLAFSPDGEVLVAGVQPNRLDNQSLTRPGYGWKVKGADLSHLTSFRLGPTSGPAAVTPDGRTLLKAFEGILSVGAMSQPDASTGVFETAAHSRPITAMAVSHDGKTVATGAADGTLALWNLSPGTPARLAALSLHENAITALAFSADDATLVSADATSIARWAAKESAEPTVLRSLDDQTEIRAVAYTPDGDTLLTGGADGTLVVRDLDGGIRQTLPKAHATRVAVSPDGKTAATCGDMDGCVLWRLAKGRLKKAATLPAGGQAGASLLLFIPNSHTLVAAGSAKSAMGIEPASRWSKAWDIQDPDHPREKSADLLRDITSVSRDGSVVVAGTSLRGPGSESDDLFSLMGLGPRTVSPAGTTLASSDFTDSALRMWDISRPGAPRQISDQPLQPPTTVAVRHVFHPSGDLLTVQRAEGLATLYDVGDPRWPRPLAILSYLLADIAFSSDGHRVAVTNKGGGVDILSIGHLAAISHDPIGLACSLSGGELSDEERDRYAPGLPKEPLCL
ncbi:caspase family protein [Streptomyces sp. 35G-GA-8]|uniref:caspase, EACC1-associated type n=1 Tax=Streptomyces sp. 35G-GA-8 TaxID=2939434 RepID=UPI0035B4EBED